MEITADVNEIADKLIQLGELYGTAGFVAAKQAVIADAVVWIVAGTLLVLPLTWGCVFCVRKASNLKAWEEGIGWAIGASCSGVGAAGFVCCVATSVSRLVASDWYAAKALVGLVL